MEGVFGSVQDLVFESSSTPLQRNCGQLPALVYLKTGMPAEALTKAGRAACIYSNHVRKDTVCVLRIWVLLLRILTSFVVHSAVAT